MVFTYLYELSRNKNLNCFMYSMTFNILAIQKKINKHFQLNGKYKRNPFFYSFSQPSFFNLIIIQSSHFPKLIRVYIEEAVKYRRKKTLLISTTEYMPISIFDCYQFISQIVPSIISFTNMPRKKYFNMNFLHFQKKK